MGNDLIQIGMTPKNGMEQKSISNNNGDNHIKIGLTNPKICLVSYLDLDCSNFPIGIATISALLKKMGYSVTVLDFEVKKKKMESEGIKNIPIGIEDFDVSDFDVICFSLIAGKCLSFCLYHIDRIKSSTDKTIITGGPLIDSMPETVLKESKADFICVGEGEEVIINFMNALKEKSQEEFYDKLSSVPGLGYRHNGKIVINQPGDITDMDKLPIPDYESFDMEIYLEHKSDLQDRNVKLYTARGCPFSCQFCYHTFGKKWRAQSPINIIEHIKYLKEHYNITKVSFCDEVFMFSRERTLEFCKLVKPLDIKWMCQSRCTDIDEYILTEMKDSGCIELRMGLESGGNRMLKEMRKAHTAEQSWKAIECYKKVGVRVIAGFMVGMPNETIEDANETLQFIKKIYKLCPDAYLRTYYFNPRPKTPWYDLAIQKGMKEISLKGLCDMDKFHDSFFNTSNMTEKQIKTIILKANIYQMYYEDFLKKGGIKRFIKFVTKPINIKKMIRRFITEVTPN